MRIVLEEDINAREIEVLIKYSEKNNEVIALIERINSLNEKILGYGDEEENICVVSIKDIFYAESVDNNTFIYLETEVFKTKQRLYELEKLFGDIYFFRCNKSTIINVSKIKELKPYANRTIMATMDNGERVYISRLYVKKLKEILGG